MSDPPRTLSVRYFQSMSNDTIGRILVCMDGSEGSAAALRWAISLAKAADAEVVAVHVLELPYPLLAPPAGGASLGVGAEVASFEESYRKQVEEAFRTVWCAPLLEAGVRYRLKFGEGRPGPTLVEAAEQEHVDLVATGRRGLGSLNELIAGSVSQYLVHRAHRPVLIVPTP